jgi:UDP-N-acetylglucosamine--N-acetylmuramyl-(pentapeptide) pyrophosphoryl-undecaprenol N-acetylglucosamine transferase
VSRAVVLAAGGTGGHLFGAEALAGELLSLNKEVHLLSDARAETFAKQLPEIEVHQIRAGRFGDGLANTAHAFGEVAIGVLQARRLLRRINPACVIGFGGYPSVPSMLAAVSLGRPTLIHEQNAVLGRANRLLAPRVQQISTGFPSAAGMRPSDRARTVYVGNPVRSGVLARAPTRYKALLRGAPIELLILGGSQGARIMSDIVPLALAALPTRYREMLRVSQQARPEDLAAAETVYREKGIAAEVQSFFADVPERLAQVHLVICRAGASTIAELAAIGRPAILIPYPYATDDHQTANARAFAEAGGGWVITQAELRPDTLALHLEYLLGDQAALTEAARCAAQFGRRDATRDLARLAIDLHIGSCPQGRAA